MNTAEGRTEVQLNYALPFSSNLFLILFLLFLYVCVTHIQRSVEARRSQIP